MKRAWLNLRYTPTERVQAFKQGLARNGYGVHTDTPKNPQAGDIYCTWNRINIGDHWARRFAAMGNRVLVVENSSWGNEFAGGGWLTIARDFHNMAGKFPVGDSDRWDRLGVELEPWRTSGETVILPQRGFGPAGVAMPMGWERRKAGRIRRHPGRGHATPLKDDLAKAGKVITWGSAAAVQALMWGIPVESDMPNWIAEQDNTDSGRLAMFRRLAFAQWHINEIRQGTPFEWLFGQSASHTQHSGAIDGWLKQCAKGSDAAVIDPIRIP